MNAWLPPQPRLVLRGQENKFASLSPDGKLLTTITWQDVTRVSLRTWDTFTGQLRHEFFRGKAGIDRETFLNDHWVFSPDRRFCALLHTRGLSLADLNTGWESAAALAFANRRPVRPEMFANFRLLQTTIDTKELHEKGKLKNALDFFIAKFEGKLKIRIDEDAFAADARPDDIDIREEEVNLPPVPSKMVFYAALRFVLSQVGRGDCTMMIRHDCIEITTQKRALAEEVWPPVFSPRGMYVALMEGHPDQNKLHVVESSTGKCIAELAVHADAYDVFRFTPNDELLIYFAPQNGKPVFTVWNTRTQKVVRSVAEIPFFKDINTYQLAPDGKTLLVNCHIPDSDGVDLFDLHTGEKCRVCESPGSLKKPVNWQNSTFLFAHDQRTLVRNTTRQIEIWDLAKGIRRALIKRGQSDDPNQPLIVSADSRVLCALKNEDFPFTAWSLESGKRLWPNLPIVQDRPPVVEKGGPQVVIIERNGFAEDEYPRHTPDNRFLFERSDSCVALLDPASGNTTATLTLGKGAVCRGPIGFTPDGRTMVTGWRLGENREPGFFEKWLGKWWPSAPASGCFVVSDVAMARSHLRIALREPLGPYSAMLADDGQTLVLVDSGSRVASVEGATISVWDVSARPSPYFVYGIPAIVALLVLGIRCWVQRKSRARQNSPDLMAKGASVDTKA